MSEVKSAGDIIDARCTKCKDITNHTVVAMVEEKVERVKCNVCDGEHKYRGVPRRKGGAAASGTAATRRKDPTVEERAEWEAMREKLEKSETVPYAMDGAFKKKDVLSHKTFGIGLVLTVLGSRKMEVLFQDGKKLLRCA